MPDDFDEGEVWRNLVDPIGSRNAQIYELRSELKSLLLLVDALIDGRIDIKDIAEEIALIKSRNLFLNEDDSWKDIFLTP